MIRYFSFVSHKKMYGPTDSEWLLPNVNRQKMNPPIITPVKKKFFINGIHGDPFGYQRAT